MSFFIIHELQGLNGTATGRMRVRADRPLPPPPAADLTRNLEELPGISDVRVNPRVGSVLFFYADRESRLSALRLLAVRDEAPAPDTPDNISDLLPEEPPAGGVLPLIRFFVIRPFLPRIWRVITSVAAAAPFLLKGVASLLRGRLSVDVLDAAAITASILMRDFRTVSVLTLLLGLGETLEYWTRRRSLDSLTESLALNVDSVWLLGEDGTEVSVPLSQVQKDDLVVVRDGGSIPVDGIVEDGCAVVNQSSMTGEPLGVPRAKGASVFAGTVVEEGRLVIRVSHVGDGTRLRQVVTFIEQSEALKAGIQGKTERLADLAVPFTFGLAALVWLITRNPMRAASVLLVDYSCALKLAIPIAVLSAMRESSGYHISVKGGRFLEAVAKADTIVFDKTGTLTYATPTVAAVIPFGGHDEAEMLRLAACLEEHYPHSMANAVVAEAKRHGLTHEEYHSQVQYVVAHGISSMVEGKKVIIGSAHFVFEDEGCRIPEGEQPKFDALPAAYSHLYLCIDGELAAVICIHDPLRREAREAVRALHESGFTNVVMMTGDNRRTAEAVAAEVGVDAVYAEVLPEDKAAFIRQEKAKGHTVIMVGDGVNDSPALSEADAGIAISTGAAIAREIADITVSSEDLFALVTLRRLGEALMERIHGSYRFIVGFNLTLIALGVAGVLPPATSALLHNGSTLGISLRNMTDLLDDEENTQK